MMKPERWMVQVPIEKEPGPYSLTRNEKDEILKITRRMNLSAGGSIAAALRTYILKPIKDIREQQ